MFRRLLGFAVVAAFILAAAPAFAQTDFDKAEYFLKAAPGQKKGETIKGTLRFSSSVKQVQFISGRGTDLAIKYDALKSMSYERAAKPRYGLGLLVAWPLLFTKSKKHWLTFQYTDASGTGQYAIIRLDKSNFREALATAEAETGKKVERSEER
jgi:hypothetical protein